MRAKTEFIKHTDGRDVVCAHITNGDDYLDDYLDDEEIKTVILKKGHTDEEYEEFLKALNFSYDDGFGGQELFGHIWYEDGTWSERDEYDGSECWRHVVKPKIPKECK